MSLVDRSEAAMEFYLEGCLARGHSDRTVDNKRYVLRAFIAWSTTRGVTVPMQVTPELLEDYRRHLYRHRKIDGEPLTLATQRKCLTAVKTMFRSLKRARIVLIDPTEDFELPRLPRRLPRDVMNTDEIDSICRQVGIDPLYGVRDRAMVELFYATGLRRTELANLDIPDIDLKAGTVRVRKGKGGHERMVPVHATACRWIAQYLERIRPRLCKLASGPALFLTSRGNRFSGKQLTWKMREHLRRAGVQKRGACTIYRHSVATHMLQNGADIRVIQELLGHVDISTTQIYTRVFNRQLCEVYARTHPSARRSSDNPPSTKHLE